VITKELTLMGFLEVIQLPFWVWLCFATVLMVRLLIWIFKV